MMKMKIWYYIERRHGELSAEEGSALKKDSAVTKGINAIN